MSKRDRHLERGMTLTGLVLGMVLGTMLTVMLFSAVVSGLKYIRDLRSMERLHADSSYIMNTLFYQVQQGESFVTPNPSILVVHMPNGSTKTIQQNGTTIQLNGTPLITGAVHVDALTFTKLIYSVQVHLKLDDTATNKTIDITTTIALHY